jgi:Tol biopolymer transport system component
MDLASGVVTPLTRDGKLSALYPNPWSPDSKRILVTARGGIQAVAAGSGKIDVLTTETPVGEDWSPDGGSILCADFGGTRRFLLPLSPGGKLQSVLTTSYRTYNMRISPDGKYVAYQSDEASGQEIFVASFPSFAEKRRVSTTGGLAPLWTKGGKELVYALQDGTVTAADVRTGASIEIGEGQTLFRSARLSGSRFGATADGQRFLLPEAPEQNSPRLPEITVMLNWFAEVGQARSESRP